MKRFEYKIVFFMLLFCNLIGCATIHTNIENRDEYNVILIEYQRRYLIHIDYIMGNFRMEGRSGIREFEGNTGRIISRDFTFFERNTLISRIELIQRKIDGFTFETTGSLLEIGWNTRNFVKFTDTNNRSTEYEVFNGRDGNYLTIHDKTIGIIEFNYIVANDIHTGFDIIVNNERFGILAFYPEPFRGGFVKPALFILKENELQRNIAMYIMTVYLNYNTFSNY